MSLYSTTPVFQGLTIAFRTHSLFPDPPTGHDTEYCEAFFIRDEPVSVL